MARCFDCQHWTPHEYGPEPSEDPEDIDGVCRAMDGVLLPESWKWCPREVVGTTGAAGASCPCFKLRA